MRLSGFLVGTVVGVLATRYMMQGGKLSRIVPSMAGVGSSAGKAMGQVIFNRSSADKEHAQEGKGMGQVGDLVNRDPAVKAQVSEILRENNRTAEELH